MTIPWIGEEVVRDQTAILADALLDDRGGDRRRLRCRDVRLAGTESR
jgi:hypothetical protein